MRTHSVYHQHMTLRLIAYQIKIECFGLHDCFILEKSFKSSILTELMLLFIVSLA